MGERVLAYRFALDLNVLQEQAAWSHVGARRFAFNHMLGLVKATMSQREAERSYGVPEEDLTPSANWSAYGLRKTWNTRKALVAPWWSENSKEAYADGCARLAAALSNWVKGRAGTRKGAAGFPRFQSRAGRQSVSFTTGTIRIDDTRHVVLPVLGRLRTYEDTTRLLEPITAGTARISRAALSWERSRWFVSFTVHQHVDPVVARHRVAGPVGIDLGLKDLIVLADTTGRELERVPAPKHFAEAQRRLRALQRKAARQIGPYDPVNRKQEPSARWRKTQARAARAHARVANLRENALHQVTTHLARTYADIVIEDLYVTGMMSRGGAHKRGLNRGIGDAAFGELARQLAYKTQWAGGTLTRADRWYPSSKTCSTCQTVKAKLSLAERTYRCDICGARIDRDLNAAINLARIPRASAGVPGRDASGAAQKTTHAVAGGNEAGTCPGRSATPQEVAA